jgi:hypothetical protein
MILDPSLQPVFDGSQAVADAILPVMQDLGVNCDLVGIQEGIQLCSPSASFSSTSTFSLHVLSVLFMGGTAAVMMF